MFISYITHDNMWQPMELHKGVRLSPCGLMSDCFRSFLALLFLEIMPRCGDTNCCRGVANYNKAYFHLLVYGLMENRNLIVLGARVTYGQHAI